MRPPVKVTVTQDDIDQGIPHSALTCPLAKALARADGNKWSVIAKSARRFAENLYHKLPPEAIDFRQNFDLDQPTHPFKFDLDLSNPGPPQ